MVNKTLRPLALALVLLVSAGRGLKAQNDDQRPRGNPEARGGVEFVSGTVSSVGVDRFQIQKQDGTTVTVMVSDQTRYRQGQQEIGLEDLKPGDRVVARGRNDSNSQFAAFLVRRLTGEELERFQRAGDAVFGRIVSIDKTQLKVRNPMQGERTILVNDQTAFVKEGKPISLNDLKVDERIFARGKETNGQFLATEVVTGRMQYGGRGEGRGQSPPGTQHH